MMVVLLCKWLYPSYDGAVSPLNEHVRINAVRRIWDWRRRRTKWKEMSLDKPGRRRIYPEVAMEVYYARLTATHARFARRIGQGNLSEGIRLAIEHYEQCPEAQKIKPAG
jgi:hypothetical protein